MNSDIFDNISIKNDIDIPVPDELENRIMETVRKLPGRPPKYLIWTRNIAAGVLAAFGIFTASIFISPGFAMAASRVPIVGDIVEWLRGDEGIKAAVKEGYQTLEEVNLEVDGFELTLRDIILDRDRLRLAAILGGKKVEDSISERKGQSEKAVNVNDMPLESEEPAVPNYGLDIFFMDFRNGSSASSFQTDGYITRDVECSFKTGELDEFLEQGRDYLTIRAVVTDWKNGGKGITVAEFNDIRIPFDRSAIGKEYNYKYGKKHKYGLGCITINSLSINPTRMRLDLKADEMDHSLFFTGFKNPRIEDGKGKVYKPGGLISRGFADSLSMYFVPSAYYSKKIPEKLYFCFDGIDYGSYVGRSLKIKNTTAAQMFDYMGVRIAVSNVNYHESGNLSFDLTYNSPAGLSIQGVSLEEQGMEEGRSMSWGSMDLPDGGKKYNVSFSDVPRLDEYTLVIEYPHYPLNEPGKIELTLKSDNR